MRFHIYSIASGKDLGVYGGESKMEAIEAMWADAGWEVSTRDIRALRDEADDAGDAEQVAACVVALAHPNSPERAECERVIKDTAAAGFVCRVER